MGHAVSSDVYCLHSVYELYIAIAPSRGNSTALRREQPKIRALGVFVRLSPPSLPSNLSRLAAFSFKSGSRSTDIILPINQNRVLSNATQDNRVALLQLCFPGEYREYAVSPQNGYWRQSSQQGRAAHYKQKFVQPRAYLQAYRPSRVSEQNAQ